MVDGLTHSAKKVGDTQQNVSIKKDTVRVFDQLIMFDIFFYLTVNIKVKCRSLVKQFYFKTIQFSIHMQLDLFNT